MIRAHLTRIKPLLTTPTPIQGGERNWPSVYFSPKWGVAQEKRRIGPSFCECSVHAALRGVLGMMAITHFP